MTGILKSPEWHTQREHMLKFHCMLELRQYAMLRGRRILMNSPEIDEAKYDMMIEDNYFYLPIQFKAKVSTAQTKIWDIGIGLLKPNMYDIVHLAIPNAGPVRGGNVSGGGGGVFLQIVDEEKWEKMGMLACEYYYLDFFYLLSIYMGYWKVVNISKENAWQMIQRILTSPNKETVQIPLKAFLPIISPKMVLEHRFFMEGASAYSGIFISNEEKPDIETDVVVKSLRKSLSLYIPEQHSENYPNYVPIDYKGAHI